MNLVQLLEDLEPDFNFSVGKDLAAGDFWTSDEAVSAGLSEYGLALSSLPEEGFYTQQGSSFLSDLKQVFWDNIWSTAADHTAQAQQKWAMVGQLNQERLDYERQYGAAWDGHIGNTFQQLALSVDALFEFGFALPLGFVDAYFGLPLETATGGAIPADFASNASVTIGGLFIGTGEVNMLSRGTVRASSAWSAESVGASGFGGAYATNGELVQSIATRADLWGIRKGLGNGPAAGTLKHGYAESLLSRYQRMFGDRGLTPEARYVNGSPWQNGDPLKGSIRLDVVEGALANTAYVWDYNFGNATLSLSCITQIQTGIPSGANVPVEMMKP